MANVIGAICGISKNLFFDGKKSDVAGFEIYPLPGGWTGGAPLFTMNGPSGRVIHPRTCPIYE
jgi:hypothetical protein